MAAAVYILKTVCARAPLKERLYWPCSAGSVVGFTCSPDRSASPPPSGRGLGSEIASLGASQLQMPDSGVPHGPLKQ